MFDAWKKFQTNSPKWCWFNGDESHRIESAKNRQNKNTPLFSSRFPKKAFPPGQPPRFFFRGLPDATGQGVGA